MKPLPLSPEEVSRALEDGKVVLERPMEPQPLGKVEPMKSQDDFFFDSRPGDFGLIKSPFSAIGIEFFGQEEWAKVFDHKTPLRIVYKAEEGLKLKYWRPADTMPEGYSRLTLIHTGTEVKQVDGIWKWFGTMEVKG